MKIAVACSGLGHVRRGIEAWAADLASALRRRGADVQLFGGAPAQDAIALPCARRDGRTAIALTKLFRHLSGWRYGLGWPYEVEQTTFSILLWLNIYRAFDILHVQDPLVGRVLDRLNLMGLSRPRVILANGTGEKPEVLARFSFVQQLTPEAAREWEARRPPKQTAFAIPNFVDIGVFSPGDKFAARSKYDLPQDASVFLCCAAIRRVHKRIDYLVKEFARFSAHTKQQCVLIIAGGREPDTDDLVTAARTLLGDRVKVLIDVPRSDMPELYRAADVFVLPSLTEPFGIVLLEAMASGLPVICNDSRAFRTIVGPAGLLCDLSKKSALANALGVLCDPGERGRLAAAARAHISAHYSEEIVIAQIMEMYEVVAQSGIH